MSIIHRMLPCAFRKMALLQAVPFLLSRAVAAGPVSPVSTGPLFPSLVDCPVLGGRPCNAPKHLGTMLKLARWLRTVQQNCSASLPTTFRSYRRTISLASFTCEGCGFRPISKLDRKAVYDALGRMAFM